MRRKANYEFSEAEFKRFKELRDQGFISGRARAPRDHAEGGARRSTSRRGPRPACRAIRPRYATLMADASGVITGVDAEPGAVVAAGAPVVRLAHDGPRDVVFAVPEDRVADAARAGRQGAAH